MTWLLAAGLLFGITQDEIIQMSREGANDHAILSQIDKDRSTFKLSADDVVGLRKAGVSERVVLHMLGGGAVAGEGLEIVNKTGKPLAIAVGSDFIEFGRGTEIAAGKTVKLQAEEGEYAIVYGGKTRRVTIHAPARVTVKAHEIGSVDALMLIIEDEGGRRVTLLEVKERPRVEAPRWHTPTRVAIRMRDPGLFGLLGF